MEDLWYIKQVWFICAITVHYFMVLMECIIMAEEKEPIVIKGKYFIIECPICNKTIEGTSEANVKFLYRIHLQSIHGG